MRHLYLFLSFYLLCCIPTEAQPRKFDRSEIPQPIFENNNELVDLYWLAWKQAYDHVKHQPGLVQAWYMDEGLWDDTIWVWDSEFMALFCKYAPKLFPGIETLDNFYYTALEKDKSSLRIQHPDNPPFYSWVEDTYFKMTNDRDHIQKLLFEKQFLQRYYAWFDSLKPGTKLHFTHAPIALEKKSLGYNWGGVQSGMDNTPRGRGKQKGLLWVDAISQQALSALYISRLAKNFNNKALHKEYATKYEELKSIVNRYYWDEQDGTYYDLREEDLSHVKVATPASFWAMLAEIPSKRQAARMAQLIADERIMGGERPWVSVSRQDKAFNSNTGEYWSGGIWLPTAYMGIKALEKYGYFDLANQTAEKIVLHQLCTYKEYTPHTIWECYSPSKPEPSTEYGKLVRPDFCGWSALGPISLLIENILGFHTIDAQKREIVWYKHQSGRHGIRNLSFGEIKTDIIGDGNNVEVHSNAPYTLYISGRKFRIKAGLNFIKL